SEGLSPVAAANTTIGPNIGPRRSASDRICAQDSNGRCSRQRRPGFGTPRVAGFSSISFHATARFSTCRSAWVASKRCPSETVSRHARTRSGRELRETHLARLGGRLPEQPAQLRDRDALALMRLEVLLHPLAERQRRRTPARHQPGQLVLKRPLRLSPPANPPTCNLVEPRPATRYR